MDGVVERRKMETGTDRGGRRGGRGGEEAYYFKHTAPLLSHSMAADQKRWTE